MIINRALIFALFVFALLSGARDLRAQNARTILGVKLQPDVAAIAGEIEARTKKRIVAVFDEFESPYVLGSSFIGEDDGVAYIRIQSALEGDKRLEAVLAHELLHLRLRANGFPVFLFSPKIKTAKGLAQDVEQPNVNDLLSLIEHRVFKSEMERFKLLEVIDLAGDTERSARASRGKEDGQADSLNFARALLEYQKPEEISRLREIYQRNGWRRALADGQFIADAIANSNPKSAADVTAVFRKCLARLYPTPRPLKLAPDRTVKTYSQFLITY